MSRIYIGMSSDGKAVDISLLGRGDPPIPVTNVRELVEAIGKLATDNKIDVDYLFDEGFSHSSSMNHPEEYTSDPDLIAFTDELMGG